MDIIQNIAIILTYILVIAAAATALVFGIIQYMSKIKESWKTALGVIGGIILVMVISYFLASDEILTSWEKYEITTSTSKRVGMGLVTLCILGGGAIISLLAMEIISKMKNS